MEELFETRVMKPFLKEGDIERLMDYVKEAVTDLGDIQPMVVFGRDWGDDHWAISPVMEEGEHPIDALGGILMFAASFGYGAAAFMGVNMRFVDPEEFETEKHKPVTEHIESSEAVLILEVLGDKTIQQAVVQFGRDDYGQPHNFEARVMESFEGAHDGSNWGDMLKRITSSQEAHSTLMDALEKPANTYMKADRMTVEVALQTVKQRASVARIENGDYELFDVGGSSWA